MSTWQITRGSSTATTDEDAAMAFRAFPRVEGDLETARDVLVTLILAEARAWIEGPYDDDLSCVTRLAHLARAAGRLTERALGSRGVARVEHEGLEFTLCRVGG